MKFLAALTAFACLAAAAPAELDTRQLGSSTATDLEKGQSSNCPSAILIFARGSTETGNMVCSPRAWDFPKTLGVRLYI
jgi:cutinase